MRIFLLFFVLFSSSISASELCPNAKITIVEDMRITENDLTKERALFALSTLTKIAEGSIEVLNEFETDLARLNSQKVVRGYFLKLEAEKERKGNSLYEGANKVFCSFLEKEAFWHD